MSFGPACALDLVREFRYDPGRVTLRANGGFTEVMARGGLPELRTGLPGLPRISETVDLPEGYRIDRVEIEALETEPLAGSMRPLPAPEIRRGAPEPIAAAPDPAAYAKAGWQPEIPATLGYQGFERGRNRAMLMVTPVRWEAASGRLERVSRIALRLRLVATDQRPLARERVVPEWESSAPGPTTAARSPGAALRAEPYRPTQIPSLLGSPVAYVIVTNDAMASTFQQLADWKTQSGTPAVVRTVSFIRQQYPAGVDDAERVRQFIQDAYSRWGTRWVLLGGDVDVVPTRTIHTVTYGGENIPTDLYYSCLDGTWNADGDSLWGEGWINSSYPGDSCDLLPEVWVGRAPTETPGDAQLFVNKTLGYEKTPVSDYMTNWFYFAQVLAPQPWYPGQGTWLDGAELVDLDLLPIFDGLPWLHVVRMYQNYTDSRWRPGSFPENRQAVIDSLNRGYNVSVHIGHGYITVMSCGDANFDNEDAMALTNGVRTTNLYAIDCTSNAIDSQSLGEAYMRAPNGGAVTCIGSTRLDFPQTGRNFESEYFSLLLQDSVTAVGEAQGRQKLPFVGDAYYDGLTRWTETALLLLGDPELRIYTNTPRLLTVGNPSSILVSDTTFTVNVSISGTPLYGARVTAWLPGHDYRSVTTDGAGNAAVPFHPDSLGSITLTVTAFNARPVQKTIAVVASAGAAALEEQAITVVDDNLSGRRGNNNGLLDAGEIVDLRIPVRNTGGANANSVTGTLTTTDGLITVASTGVAYGTIAAGAVSAPGAGYRVTVPYDCGDQREVPFKLDLITSNNKHTAQTFSIVVRGPELNPVSHAESETGGNNNGRPEPGETVSYTFRVRNLGTGESHGITGRLRNYDGLATVLDSALTVPDLAAGAETTATVVRFMPSSTAARLTLLLSDAYGLRTTRTLDLLYPNPVITLQATGGTGSAHLTWAHSGAADLAGYWIYRRAGGIGPYRKVNVVPTPRSSLFDDIGLLPLTRYDYEVTAVDSSGNESAVSSPVTITTAPPYHPGFPITVGHSTPTPITIDRIDPGISQDILVGANVLYLYRSDGTAPVDADGLPDTPGDFTTHGTYFAGGGAISDLDGDGQKEIIGAAWNTQQLWAFEPNGSVRPGFPAALRDQVWSSVAVGDLDGDGTKELVFGSLSTVDNNLGRDLFVFRANGTEWMDGDNNPATLGVFKVMGANYNLGTPALADLLGNGQKDIVFGSFDGTLYAWKPDGSNVPGFPVVLGPPIVSSVAIGRIDGPNNPPSIVVACSNDSVYAFRTTGARHAGFPVAVKCSGVSMEPSPALADMNGDGMLDVVCASTDGWIKVFDHNGTALAPWGLQSRFSSLFESANESSPVVADIDGDGANDVVVGDESGWLSALSGATGQMLPGFPIQLAAAATGTPAVCDCDGDGKTEIVTMDYGRTLYMWDYDNQFAPAATSAWPQFHHDAEHTGNADTPITLSAGGTPPAPPRALELSPPRPNPARGPVEIAWGVPVDQLGRASEVAVYDLSGRRVQKLEGGPARAGRHTARWDLRDARGAPVRSGVYFVRVESGSASLSRKLLVIR